MAAGEFYDWQRDPGFMSDFGCGEKPRHPEVCQGPLDVDVSIDANRLAYEAALDLWYAKLIDPGVSLETRRRNVEHEISRFVPEELAADISHYALRDVNEFNPNNDSAVNLG